jgi:2,5-diamino-6-(ribosylamino)-4(3H)-pyrimidinone 5'-phosphate reductase
MSADGKIALPNGNQMRISSDEDIRRMYELRNECDAVLVGIGTILSDNPKLTINEKYVKNPSQPLRIVLDSKCRTPYDSQVVNHIAKTLIITKKKYNNIFGDNVEIIDIAINSDGLIDLKILLDILHRRGIKKLMVEGGGTVIWSFLRLGLVDDLFVYTAPIIIGGKITPTIADGPGIQNEDDFIPLKITSITKLGKGILINYKLL